MRTPCQDCGDRYVNCHAECGAYKSWKTKEEEEKEVINRLKRIEGQATKRRNDVLAKLRKRYGKY